MRQVTKKVCSAFIERKPAHSVNTITNGSILTLFGNQIAWWDVEEPDVLWITFAGQPTTTTKDRINGVCDLLGLGKPFYSKDFQLYFGSALRPIDSREHVRIDVPLAHRCIANQTIAA
jgi:hypothetical protein